MTRALLAFVVVVLSLPTARACDEVEELVEQVRSAAGSGRERAGAKLAEAGARALAPLVGLLADPRVEVRRTAALALADLALDAPKTKTAPKGEPKPAPGGFSFEGGEAPGPAPYPALGKPALASLGRALADEDAEVRARIARACPRLGPQGVALLGPLRQALKEPALQYNAALALSKLGPKAAPALPDLLPLLDASDDETCQAAAAAIGAVGPAAASAVDALVATWSRRVAGEGAEGEGEPAAGGAGADLEGTLSFEDPLDDELVRALASIGPAARERLTALAGGKTPLARPAKELLEKRPAGVRFELEPR